MKTTLVLGAAILIGCSRPASGAPGRAQLRAEPVAATAASAGFRAGPAIFPRKIDRAAYAWLDDPTVKAPAPVDTLEQRFTTPAGFTRVAETPHGFGAWLRGLPLAARGTPVKSYDGSVLHPASDRRIAAVAAIDVGTADLQQCADAVIRLDAEWRWSGGKRDMSYRAASGTPLPFARWARGERVVPRGRDIAWQPMAKPASTHAALRRYLDTVFAWANTVSLSRQAKPVAPADLRPGDFFVMGGNPGHTVLVLDVATAKDGTRVALLGQSYMPAQSYQVLRDVNGSAWFALDPSKDVFTPFWRPFPWDTLRRLD